MKMIKFKHLDGNDCLIYKDYIIGVLPIPNTGNHGLRTIMLSTCQYVEVTNTMDEIQKLLSN